MNISRHIYAGSELELYASTWGLLVGLTDKSRLDNDGRSLSNTCMCAALEQKLCLIRGNL